ncbi:MAG: hypothetical protein ACKVOU_14515 [Cytophagales bacterium]
MRAQTNYLNTTIQVQVPSKWEISGIDNDVYVEALKRSIIHRLDESKREFNLVMSKINLFAAKYGAFDEFAKNLENSFEQHEEWVEWSFLEKQKAELLMVINKFNSMIK